MKLTPTWKNGKEHGYTSSFREEESDPANPQQNPTGVDDQPSEALAADSLPKTPERHVEVENEATSANLPSSTEVKCGICGSIENTSFWIGCGYKNPITKIKDCPYWVHQWCIGLYYQTESSLGRVPLYCEKHGENKRIKKVGCQKDA